MSPRISRLLAGIFLSLLAAASARIPVFVMMPLDTVLSDGALNNPPAIAANLSKLASGGVDGVMLDFWWGIVEQGSPQKYNWSPYLQFAQLVKNSGLALHCVLSFHQCGGNVGDTCDIPLPMFVRNVGNANPDIYYTDVHGNRDMEYLSIGVDSEPLFQGRTALQMYRDFILSFSQTFESLLGTVITDVEVGLGPAGEMRYPSYQLQHWSFPGVGAFQCFDKYLLAQLASAAAGAGHPEWGHGGPDDAGDYNSYPSQAPFFQDGTTDNYRSSYGQFFLRWYFQTLLQHGEAIISFATSVLSKHRLTVAAKVAGIHWWYLDPSHAAELTAGYWNTADNDAYSQIAQMLKKYNAAFDFTCLEMRDSE